LSVRAKQQLSIDEQASFPIGSEILLRDFYVNDLISGSGTVKDAISIMQLSDPSSDQLLFSFSVFQSPLRPRRRSVLSAIAKFYDPLGLVGPEITITICHAFEVAGIDF